MRGFGDSNPSTYSKRLQLKDQVELMHLGPEYKPCRLYGPIYGFMQAWVPTTMKGKDNNYVTFPVFCLDYDPIKDDIVGNNCPWRKAGLYFQKRYLSNAIDRDEQSRPDRRRPQLTEYERKERRVVGGENFFHRCKEMGSRSWTPFRVVNVPAPTVGEKLKRWENMNRHNGDSYPLSHPKYGRDIMLRIDEKAAPANYWDLDKGEKSSLSQEEKDYLMFKLDVSSIQPPPLEEAIEEFKRIRKDINWREIESKSKGRGGGRDRDEDIEEDDRRGGRRSQVGFRGRDRDEDDLDDDERRPTRGRGRDRDRYDEDEDRDAYDNQRSARGRSRDEDEDDEDDRSNGTRRSTRGRGRDEDDDDRDTRRGRGRDRDEDDDDERETRGRGRGRDEDEEDEDDRGTRRGRDRDDEDERPRNRGRGRDDDDDDRDRGRQRGRGRDDDDDDIDIVDDDDRGSRRGRGRDDDDDRDDDRRGRGDDDSDDLDDDLEDDDRRRPPPRRGRDDDRDDRRSSRRDD